MKNIKAFDGHLFMANLNPKKSSRKNFTQIYVCLFIKWMLCSVYIEIIPNYWTILFIFFLEEKKRDDFFGKENCSNCLRTEQIHLNREKCKNKQ